MAFLALKSMCRVTSTMIEVPIIHVTTLICKGRLTMHRSGRNNKLDSTLKIVNYLAFITIGKLNQT
mgnify:CR=1 FL=1